MNTQELETLIVNEGGPFGAIQYLIDNIRPGKEGSDQLLDDLYEILRLRHCDIKGTYTGNGKETWYEYIDKIWKENNKKIL